MECAGSHATPRRSKTRFDPWRGHLVFDAGARRPGNRLQPGPSGFRLPPASLLYAIPQQDFEEITGAKKERCRPGQRRTPFRPHRRRLAMCVPCMGSDEGRYRAWLAQWVEHQTMNLAVTGSTPVPTPRAEHPLLDAKASTMKPDGGGRSYGRPTTRVGASSRWSLDDRLCAGSQDEPGKMVLTCRWQHIWMPCSTWIPLRPAFGTAAGNAGRHAVGAMVLTVKSLAEAAADRSVCRCSNALRTRMCDRLTSRHLTAFCPVLETRKEEDR